MRAFIVRPFGVKPDKQGKTIDFDAVERELIGPALRRHGIEGRTTGEIAAAGNIREDMFRLLIAADIVIADISIHNANAFYELGIRHALRPRRTFLISCSADATVFDLATDRYLQYDREQPAACLERLIEGLRQTVDSERTDSPVFLLLPNLAAQPFDRLLPVPIDFREAVDLAARERQVGDLRLLVAEARGFEWESVALRFIGRAQFELEAYPGARVTWEAVRVVDGDGDLEANTRLATIYERLDDLVRSNQAVARALAAAQITAAERAELLALTARNSKRLWLADWRDQPAEARQQAALRSPRLDEAIAAYSDGYAADLNHFYAGLNALVLLTMASELATACPEAWLEHFESDAGAAAELALRQTRCEQLASAVTLSLHSARQRARRDGSKDFWLEISEAELRLLTSSRPAFVANGYRQALAGATDLGAASARQQLELYRQLGVRAANAEASLQAFPSRTVPPATPIGPAPRAILFVGHMIDAPSRQAPRFPPQCVAAARQAIRDKVAEELAMPGGIAGGIAGGANGGDLLFHEVCAELGIASQLFLALPPEQFVTTSLAQAGPVWVDLLHLACDRLPPRVLSTSEGLPRWLRGKPGYDIWKRNSMWMLHNALALGRDRLTLIALWDGQPGDGPGGTADLVAEANKAGAKVVILNTRELFGL
ncbi:MAG: tetratricopeptide repeat-containing protein [Geminicoccaceae bacterium]